jgi:peptidyl-prolyl cis-trans isomerase SurA
VNLENLVPEFAAVASRTPVGQVSQVFYNESQNGFHILRVNSKSGDTVNLNHILIRVSGSNAEQAKSYLRTLRDSLVNHDASFEMLARRHSEEDRSASNGGRVTNPQSGSRDLALDRLNPTWKRVLRRLDVGEISKPTKVQLRNGDEAYHIVRLDNRTPAHRANLEQDYERIRRFALQEKKSRKMDEWLRELRDEVYVDIRITEPDMTAMRGLP